MNDQPILTLRAISKNYHQGKFLIEVLKNVDLKVNRGQLVGIIGDSGSGKSTLLHIAGLLDVADSGSVSIDGVLEEEMLNMCYANRIRLENVGFIYQHHYLLKDFTAQENAAMPLFIKGVPKKDAIKEAAELLNTLGLGNRLCNVPGELSGGEQQRVAIARALINNPKIILADEPTGNLDPHTAEEVFELFLERTEKFGVAIIMVSHNLKLVSKMHKTYKLDEKLFEEIK